MKTKFSASWKGSKQPRKQVKYRANAPLHIRGRFLKVTLSKDLKAKYEKNAVRVKKGDKVIVLRGQYKKKTGKVERVSVKESRVFMSGIEQIKKDGTKSLIPLQPSNLMITDLNLDDKKRSEKLKSNSKSKDIKSDKKPKENKVKSDK